MPALRLLQREDPPPPSRSSPASPLCPRRVGEPRAGEQGMAPSGPPPPSARRSFTTSAAWPPPSPTTSTPPRSRASTARTSSALCQRKEGEAAPSSATVPASAEGGRHWRALPPPRPTTVEMTGTGTESGAGEVQSGGRVTASLPQPLLHRPPCRTWRPLRLSFAGEWHEEAPVGSSRRGGCRHRRAATLHDAHALLLRGGDEAEVGVVAGLCEQGRSGRGGGGRARQGKSGRGSGAWAR
jgi:hypothetical protein